MDGKSRTPPFEIEVFLANNKVIMQIDTGASISIMNENTWHKVCGGLPRDALQPVSLSLRTWTETPVKLLGQVTLPIGSADSLSRWPLPVPETPEEQPGEILLMAEAPDDFPYDVEQIAKETKRDRLLTKVFLLHTKWLAH
ncbi:hypothetical protein ACJJTC_012404 [Scirpophaga incertulas]